MEKCFYSGMKKCCYNEISRYGRKGLYEKEKSHSGIDTDSHAFATEPVQIVYAETAEATHVTSESTSQLDPKPRKMQITLTVVQHRKLNPGWVAVEKGYQWRQEDGTLLQKSGWVTINGRKYYLHKEWNSLFRLADI